MRIRITSRAWVYDKSSLLNKSYFQLDTTDHDWMGETDITQKPFININTKINLLIKY